MEVRIKLYVVLVFLCTLTNSYSQDTTEVVRDYTETALRDYAFCKCLEHSQDSVALKSFLHDKDRSAAGYFNVLPIGYEEFFMLDSLASAKPCEVLYVSKYNKSLTLTKCLDFYNGQRSEEHTSELQSPFYSKQSEPTDRLHNL